MLPYPMHTTSPSSPRSPRRNAGTWKLDSNPAVANDPAMLRKALFSPNPHRRKRIVEFCDKYDPNIGVRWYELLERGMRTKKDAKEFTAIQDEAPDFLAPYVELSHSALANGDHEEAFSIASFAYVLAVQRIADRNGDWPEIMQWAWFENRPLMRALHHYAWLLWKFGQSEHAAMILRRILRMNPGDNQGIRYELLAIRLGLSHETWDDPFFVKEGPMAGQAWDAANISAWFEREAKKFPEEFNWMFAEWKKRRF
ncbi:MAG: tetratricopeptide repeat protein [Candidatus Peregrinibacteria bacterium]